ncbi:MAG: undecaprenyl-diphosphate phosphatase [Candidatus Dojkabacteria bacterium]|nr:MAG: undecaprenyl-diphosphate phosphatase [Candidatus Dojkabacteria bacterium]
MDINLYILAVVQGVSELLPISSSGHLIIFSEILKVEATVALLTLLHIATLGGIVVGYWPELMKIIKNSFRWRVLLNIVISCIPAVMLGILIGEILDEYFYNLPFVAAMLILWGVALIVTERLHDRRPVQKFNDISELRAIDALVIGLFQTLALLPGTSRSGVMTLAGVWRGMRKDIALEYAFIVGIPIIAGSFFFTVATDFEDFKPFLNMNGFVTVALAFVVSLLAVLLLKYVSKKKFLTFFGWYRIALGALLIGYLLITQL